MENIVQAVEGAIGSAEAEAKKIETEAKGETAKVETECDHLFGFDRGRNRCLKCHILPLIDPAVIQAQKDAQEDAVLVEGAFSRFIHRLWQAI